MLPVETTFTPEQSAVIQRLASDMIKNYPDCGMYEEGTTPVGKPEFAPVPTSVHNVTPVTLSSSTPGTWFRYTLDGTKPTRTRGYVYCGVISVRRNDGQYCCIQKWNGGQRGGFGDVSVNGTNKKLREPGGVIGDVCTSL